MAVPGSSRSNPQQIAGFSDFSGGWSLDEKLGVKASFGTSYGFDFRKQPTRLSALPGLEREDNNVVQDLVQNEVMGPDGTIYALGETGIVYKRGVNATWSNSGVIGTNGCFGMDYRKDTDDIYVAGTKYVSRWHNISTAPQLLPEYYGPSYSTYNGSLTAGSNTYPYTVAAYQAGSGNSYTPFEKVIEDQVDSRYFQSDIEPLNQVSLYITNAGTGTWTVVLHDGINDVLGTGTLTNAEVTANQFNNFVFSGAPNGQVRIYIAPNARTYHLHVYTSTGDGTVSVGTSQDFSTADLQIWADRLVQTNNGTHPIDRFEQYEIIGNANYISAWEPISDPPLNTEWNRSQLTVPSEYECCGLAHTNEYEVAAFEQTSTTNSLTPQMGLIVFWDGTSPTYNYFLTIEEGSPQCLQTSENVVYYYAGGAWYSLTSPTTLPVKIRTMPGSDTEFSGTNSPITIYPYAGTVRRGILLMGYPCETTATAPLFGVYSYGSSDKSLPDSFGYSYQISTGSQTYSNTNNLRIGMVKNFGDILHVSWQDSLNGNYGVDSITNASPPAPVATWTSLIIDAGYASKYKQAYYMEAYYNLTPGYTLQLAYSIDRGPWVTDENLYSSTNLWQGTPNYCRFNIDQDNQSRFHELQGQITLTRNTATQPSFIYFVGFPFDNLGQESYD